MNEHLKNMAVGFFVLVALGLCAWLILALDPTHGDGAKILRVRFSNIEKIGVGTRVNFAGNPVGEVVAVRQVSGARDETDAFGNVYVYELLLELDSSVKVYATDDIAIHTSGLLGEKSISIIPRPAKYGGALEELQHDAVVFARAPSSVDETITKFTSLALKAEETMDQVRQLIMTNNEEIFFTIKSLRKTVHNLDESIEHIQKIELVNTLKDTAESFKRFMDSSSRQLQILEQEGFAQELSESLRHVKGVMGALNEPQVLQEILESVRRFSGDLERLGQKADDSWEQFTTLLESLGEGTENFKQMSQSGKSIAKDMSQVMQQLQAGRGDLGKLLYRDDLYHNMRGILGKAGTVMNDINHYGLLFHLDKGWQRQRTKRMNLLANLQTPDQFKDYFEEEVDQITTSLARVSMLLELAEVKDHEGDNEAAFRTGFAELLRQVQNLSESLEVYSQDLIDTN